MTVGQRDLDPDLVKLGRRCWGDLETLHVVGYFAPETRQAYVDLGLHPRLSYFAARSAAFGAVDPAVTVATFYVFAPWLVGKALPAAWQVADPGTITDARRRGVLAALHQVLGDPDVSEALEISRRACDALSAHGRPLYAAHASLPWPEDDLLALWHAATLLREHRGDGHVALLISAGLDPVESLVLGGLFSHNTGFLRESRGWSDDEWSKAETRLRNRDLLDDAGALSDSGRTLRQDIEEHTDRLAVEGWAAVGADDCRRLHELVGPLRRQVLDSGVLPDWTRSRG
ncbi:MAG: SCO6745 family protein [Nocardioidaceae bacterium]